MKRSDRHRRLAADADPMVDLNAGRRAYEECAWADAYDLLSGADVSSPLAPDDLEKFAWSAALTGRDDVFLGLQERLYHALVGKNENLAAARSAFWQGMRLLTLGDMGKGGAWLARADRLVGNRDCVERGFLLLPEAYRHLLSNEPEAAIDAASAAITIGERFGEADIVALAGNLKGRALLSKGETAQGLAVLDQAMLSAAPGNVSAIVTGLVYCNVIECCQRVYALDRSREWTAALSAWCAEQPQLVTFAGSCHVHRAEIMQISGRWADAITEAQRAAGHLASSVEPEALAPAYYQEAEVYRLRGDFAAAEEAYREASRLGGETQPGLALLRLAQGRDETAAAAIRRVLGAASDRLERARLLPAHIEIMIAVGALEEAEGACRELDELARVFGGEILDAIAAHAQGALDLAAGRASSAVQPLAKAFAIWNRFGAPYLAARLRVLNGLAYRALGDEDGYALEFAAAREVFSELGAKPDLARLVALAGRLEPARLQGLTGRELQVLRLVAAGKSNKEIARDLSISGKTVDRHISNIFVKIDVPSRAAATAYAYEHHLV